MPRPPPRRQSLILGQAAPRSATSGARGVTGVITSDPRLFARARGTYGRAQAAAL